MNYSFGHVWGQLDSFIVCFIPCRCHPTVEGWKSNMNFRNIRQRKPPDSSHTSLNPYDMMDPISAHHITWPVWSRRYGGMSCGGVFVTFSRELAVSLVLWTGIVSSGKEETHWLMRESTEKLINLWIEVFKGEWGRLFVSVACTCIQAWKWRISRY